MVLHFREIQTLEAVASVFEGTRPGLYRFLNPATLASHKNSDSFQFLQPFTQSRVDWRLF